MVLAWTSVAVMAVTARRDSSEAAEACSAPAAMSSVAFRNSSVADEDWLIPLASSAVAETIRSAAFCWRAWVRTVLRLSSATRDKRPIDYLS